MPAQSLRAYRFIGQALDGGPGNARTVSWPPTGAVPAVQSLAPFITTVGFTLADITPLQEAILQVNQVGLTSNLLAGEMLLKSNSPYWLTMTWSCNGIVAQTAGLAVQLTPVAMSVAIPPNGVFFVPSNWNTLTAMTSGLLTDGTQPVAPTTTNLYFDVCAWI